MKYRKLFFVLSLLGLFVLGGCGNQLEEKPVSSREQTDAWNFQTE